MRFGHERIVAVPLYGLSMCYIATHRLDTNVSFLISCQDALTSNVSANTEDTHWRQPKWRTRSAKWKVGT
jgi:hypothetical protein